MKIAKRSTRTSGYPGNRNYHRRSLADRPRAISVYARIPATVAPNPRTLSIYRANRIAEDCPLVLRTESVTEAARESVVAPRADDHSPIPSRSTGDPLPRGFAPRV